MREELIAEPLALRGALDESGDVDEFDHRRHLFLRRDDGVELLEARIGDLDHADVRIDRAKRIILGRRRLRGSESVEQRRLTDVGESYDAEPEHGEVRG